MFILARGGRTSARLRFHLGPGGDISLPVIVAYDRAFPASDHRAWKAEYDACVEPAELVGLMDLDLRLPRQASPLDGLWDDDWLFGRDDPLDADQDHLVELAEGTYAI